MASNYHIKWDETNKKWTVAIDGASFADLVENPTVQKIKFDTGGSDPGGTYRIWADANYLHLAGNLLTYNTLFLLNDYYFNLTKSGANPLITLDNTDYLLYDRSANKLQIAIGGTLYDIMPEPFQRGGTLVNTDGITAAIAVIVWYAPFACTVKNVRGYRVGGTGATINARKNVSSNHLSSNLSLTSADTWMDGGSVTNASYAAGDKLEIAIATVAGNPTQVAVQVDFTRP